MSVIFCQSKNKLGLIFLHNYLDTDSIFRYLFSISLYCHGSDIKVWESLKTLLQNKKISRRIWYTEDKEHTWNCKPRISIVFTMIPPLQIALLMGFTWLFAYIAAWASITALWYVFILLNSLQGVYILTAFTCNRGTFGLWRSKINRCDHYCPHETLPQRHRGWWSKSWDHRKISRSMWSIILVKIDRIFIFFPLVICNSQFFCILHSNVLYHVTIILYSRPWTHTINSLYIIFYIVS